MTQLNTDEICKIIGQMKAEKYAIVNSDLLALDEYTKRLYLKVLCSIVQYESSPSEKQLFFSNVL